MTNADKQLFKMVSARNMQALRILAKMVKAHGKFVLTEFNQQGIRGADIVLLSEACRGNQNATFMCLQSGKAREVLSKSPFSVFYKRPVYVVATSTSIYP